jgi:hypothetical protein
MRFKQFQKTLKGLDELNAAERANGSTAVFGINMMSDLSPLEFKSQYLGIIMPSESERMLTDVVKVAAFKGEATSADWRGKLTTPIKNQGSCGICW